MKKLLLLCALLPFVVTAQTSLNTSLLYHWMDSTIIGTSLYDNAYNEVWGMAYNNKEFAVIGSTDGTHIFDVTDPASSSQVAYIPGAAQGTAIVHRDYHDFDGYLYIVCDEGSSTLQIVDISDLPNSFNIVYDSDSLIKRAHNIFIDESTSHLYVCSEKQIGVGNNFNALHIYDLSNPELPTHWYTYNDVSHVHDAYVKNDTAFLNCGNQGLRIVDFSMVAPLLAVMHEELGSLTTYPDAGYNHSGWLTDDGNYYVMADENHGYEMKILDVSDYSNPTVVSTFFSGVSQMESMPHNQIINGNYVYTAHYHDGIYIHDISDPNNPILVAFYDTFDPTHYNSYMGAWGVYPFLPSGNILVSDMQTGLYVFEIDYDGHTLLEENSVNNLKLFPNPTKEMLNIQFDGEGLLKMFDVSGKLLQTKVVMGGEVLNLTELQSGFYVVQLEIEKKVYHQKFIKQ